MYYLIPLTIIGVGVAYWFVSGYEAAGTILLLVFGAAMAVMGWVLLPTANDVGHTAPIDPDFEDPGR